jgi:RAD50-interacting protein 1
MNTEVQTIMNEIGLRRTAMTEFITALLPIITRKMDHILPELITSGPLLSHYMHENLVFDTTLQDDYLYIPFNQESWRGSIQHALKSPRIFNTWRDVERDCIAFVYRADISR